MPLAVSRLVLKRRCHQGPPLGPHPHMKNAFLMAGPQCETWMRLCQAHCEENERKVPESPLLTARRGGLTVYATPWSQKRGRQFGNLSFFRQYCGPVFGAASWPHFWDHERANRSCWTILTARISSICWRQHSFCNASRRRHGHTQLYNTVYYIVIDLNMSPLLSFTQLKIVQESWSFSNQAQTLEFLHHKLRAAALAWQQHKDLKIQPGKYCWRQGMAKQAVEYTTIY